MTGAAGLGTLVGMVLPPRWRKFVLTVHVITAVGWLGVDLVLLTFGIAGLAGADPEIVYPAQSMIGRLLFTPLSVLVWLVGVANAVLTPWRLFRHWWVLVKLVLTTVMLCLVLFLLYPGLVEAGDLAGALPRPDRINMVVAPTVSSSLLIFATVISTYKPWGRTPSRPVARSRSH
ncbi:hypothetical protein Adi01nite_44850 [Amorphoplanes digitatis]|nr:hypothetical protein Adi01nite_44850 [Actinoplanes digitatis]